MAKGFNPCFNGTLFETPSAIITMQRHSCFNPCFNGTLFETIGTGEVSVVWTSVSILVLMELSLRQQSAIKSF